MIDVLERRTPRERIEGKIVFIGATASDIHDVFLTPLTPGSFLPGVMIHANAYDTLMRGAAVRYPDPWLVALGAWLF